MWCFFTSVPINAMKKRYSVPHGTLWVDCNNSFKGTNFFLKTFCPTSRNIVKEITPNIQIKNNFLKALLILHYIKFYEWQSMGLDSQYQGLPVACHALLWSLAWKMHVHIARGTRSVAMGSPSGLTWHLMICFGHSVLLTITHKTQFLISK